MQPEALNLKHLRYLDASQLEELEARVGSFEDAWQEGPAAPAIGAFIPDDCAFRPALALELALVDIEWRKQLGIELDIEKYSDEAVGFRQDEHTRKILEQAVSDASSGVNRKTMRHLVRSFVSTGDDGATASLPDRSAHDVWQRVDHAGSSSASFPRRRIADFELVELLGQGAFGSVFRAKDVRLGREVAIKTPRLGTVLSAEEEERFLGEGRSAARLHHSSIVPVYEVGRSDGLLYIASECVDGVPLDQMLKREQLSSHQAAEVAWHIARALGHAHKHGVVHRDLKPSNIMMENCSDETGTIPGGGTKSASGCTSWNSRSSISDAATALSWRPRLMDFGLARRADNDASLTMDGQILGTPAYMSPEQARGNSNSVDGRSDIYSLGVILYEMLAGEVPFRGNMRMVLHQVLDDEPRPPRQLDDSIPKDIETITLKCMSKDPGKRYESAELVAAELQRFLEGHPILARPVSRAERLWKWCRRNPKIALATTVTFLALVFGLTAALVGYARVSDALKRQTVAEAESRQVVNDLLSTVANNDLLSGPGMHPVRIKLLKRAKEYLDRFRDHSNSEVTVRLSRAETLYRIGSLLHDVGDAESAEAALTQAVDILNQLRVAQPENADVSKRLGEAQTFLGQFYEKGKRRQDAKRVFLSAVQTRRNLVAMLPGEVDPRRQLANGLMNLAIVQKDLVKRKMSDNQPVDEADERLWCSAIRNMEEAQQIRLAGLDTDPKNSQLRFDTAQGYYNLACTPGFESVLSQTVALLKKAETIFQELLDEGPEDVNLIEARCGVIFSQRTAADLYFENQLDWTTKHGIREVPRDVASILRDIQKLTNENPAVVDYRKELAITQISAALATPYDDADGQLKQLEEAWSTLSQLVQENPEASLDDELNRVIQSVELVVAVQSELSGRPNAFDSWRKKTESWRSQLRDLTHSKLSHSQAAAGR